jgi:hypothetical protein
LKCAAHRCSSDPHHELAGVRSGEEHVQRFGRALEAVDDVLAGLEDFAFRCGWP